MTPKKSARQGITVRLTCTPSVVFLEVVIEQEEHIFVMTVFPPHKQIMQVIGRPPYLFGKELSENSVMVRACMLVGGVMVPRCMWEGYDYILFLNSLVNQKLLYRESDWWDVGLVVQKARKQGTVCYSEVW